MRFICKYIVLLFVICSCSHPHKSFVNAAGFDAEHITHISTGNTTPAQIVTFARSLTGIPYKYGSTDPKQGFDCSGFITYVFNHFGITVPRTSVDFTFVGREVDLNDARPGDLVLFTGTDTTATAVGHMGVISSASGEDVKFIHSTSGKAKGVTETSLAPYYIKRYVKTIRFFPQNEQKQRPGTCSI